MLPPLSTGVQPVSASITPPFSLLRAHAPDLNPLTALVLPLYPESLQVAARPCWKEVFPSVISANLSPDACTHTPVVLLVHIPVSSQETSAFTTSRVARHSTKSPYGNFCTEWLLGATVIPLCSGLQVCSPPRSLLPHQGFILSGQPWLLRPRISRFVTSPSRGYASRPKSGN